MPGLPLTIMSTSADLITVQPTHIDDTCTCGLRLQRRGIQQAVLLDLPRGERPTRLAVHWPRRTCPSGCRQTSPIDTLRGGSVAMMTARLTDAVLKRYWRGEDVTSLGRWCGAEPRTLWRLIAADSGRRLSTPRNYGHWGALTHIGIDELAWRGTYVGVVVDLVRGELLEVLPDRAVDTVTASLCEITSIVEEIRGQPWRPVIVTDMWTDYRRAVLDAFHGDAVQIIDRFHLQAKLGEDLREALRTCLPVARARPALVREIITRTLRLAREERTPELRDLPEDIPVGRHNEILGLMRLGAQFQRIWSADDRQEAEQRYLAWDWNAAQFHSLFGREACGRLRHLVQLWWEELFAGWNPETRLPGGRRVSAGAVEGVNSQLRGMIRRSGRQRVNPWGEQSCQQERFERFVLAALATVNERTTGEVTLLAEQCVPPALCRCGGTPQVHVTGNGFIHDVPWGEVPTAVRIQSAHYLCTSCGQMWTEHSANKPRGMTDALIEHLNSLRRRGWSLARLSRVSGITRERVRRVLEAPSDQQPGLPALLGVQRWRWRRHDLWVLTDPHTGLVIELLQDGSPHALGDFLRTSGATGVQAVMLARHEWAAQVPQGMVVVVDAFTASVGVQAALREVQRRYTAELSVPARRQPRYARHRRLILRNPTGMFSRDEQRTAPGDAHRLNRMLGEKADLRTAYELRQSFREILRGPGGPPTQAQLEAWCVRTVARVGTVPHAGDLVHRSLHFGFRDAVGMVRDHRLAISQGVLLGRAGVTLASSRRRLRTLKTSVGAAQPEFTVLRMSALARMDDV